MAPWVHSAPHVGRVGDQDNYREVAEELEVEIHTSTVEVIVIEHEEKRFGVQKKHGSDYHQIRDGHLPKRINYRS